MKTILLLWLILCGASYTVVSDTLSVTGSLSINGTIGIGTGPCTNFYSTTFAGSDENPISEGGNWGFGGLTVGGDWNNLVITNHLASELATNGQDYIGLMTGSWCSNQTVTAVVKITDTTHYQEMEIRLRSTVSNHVSHGYEVLYSGNSSPNNYISLVNWLGPANGSSGGACGAGCAYTVLTNWQNGPVVNTGDTIKASVTGTNFFVYLNGTLLFVTNDWVGSMWTGNPGLGGAGSSGVGGQSGFTNFTASAYQ